MKVLSTTLFLFVSNVAFACPNLTGTYSCPAWKDQAPMQFTVKQVTKGNVTAYTYEYSTGEKHTNNASEVAIEDADGGIARCEKNNYIYSRKDAQSRGETFNYINKDGNYESAVNGKVAIVCVKQ